MISSKEKLLKLINELSESELDKILDLVENLKDSQQHHSYHYWTRTSETSLEFWDQAIDDEIWNRM